MKQSILYAKKCLFCGCVFTVTKLSQFNKRKYCSHKCQYQCPVYRKNQIQGSRKQNGHHSISPEHRKKMLEGYYQTLYRKYGVPSERFVRVGKDTLDIKQSDLDDYRKTHLVCEICGKPERISTTKSGKISRLAIDHDHQTNHFRGLLCCDCNRKLGWYEAQKDNIIQYLAASSNG